VLETDSPDMPILGHQGEKNHPKNLKIILNELNVLRSESEQTIADQVFENSKSMYVICE
jgi:TatD DNase family protein